MKFSDRGKMFPWYILALGFVSGAIGYASDRDRSTSDEHYFRHQQHYNQRIEQAVNDFKLAQSHRNASHHRQVVLRHQHHDQKQLQLEEEPVPIASASAPPSGRHGHHLRHYNRHHQTWEQRVFPSLRHQITTTIAPSPQQQEEQQLKSENLHDRRSGDRVNLTGAMQSRLFDRDGLYTVSKASNGLLLKSKDSHKTRSSSLLDRDEDHNRLVDTMANRNRDREGTEEKLDDYYDDDEDSLEDDEDEVEDDDDNDDDNDDDDDTDEDRTDRGDDNNDDEYLENDDSRNRIDSDKVSSKLRSNNLVEERLLSKGGDDETATTLTMESTSGVLSKAYIPGTLTRHKYETLGTHEAVKQSRKFHITKQQHHQALMRDHVTKVNIEATCKWPKPKVEKIQKDTSKLYVPHCTILHRCGDDTSCCSSDLKTCIAKQTQNVNLYFFVKGIGSKKGAIERLTFINHTECHCVDKSKYRNYAQTAPALMRRATIFDCNCPRLFEKLLQENGTCRCDCSSGNIGCDWLKRGMEHFSMADRKCIMEGRCKYPTCEYGNYVQKHGRCPKKEDKLAFSRSFH